MAESRWKKVDPDAPAEAEKPAESRWKPAGKMTEQELTDLYLKSMDPSKALSWGAGSSATSGLMNRALGAYDWATGAAPSYGEGVDRRVAAEKALAEKHPAAHLTGSVAGGVGTGLGLAKSGVTLARQGAGLLERSVMGAGEGALYGAASGAGNTYTGNPIDYFNNAGDTAKLGLAVGAAAPGTLDLLGWAGRKAAQPFNYLRNDVDVARDRVTKAMVDAKQPVDVGGRPIDRVGALETDIGSAAAAGQPEYSVVDAIGKPAQRQLAVVAKQEGPARDLADDFLTGRNIGAPARRAGEIDRTLGVEGTAKQAEARLLEKAQTESKPLYAEAMDVKGVHNDVIAEGLSDPIMKEGLARGVKLQRINNAMTGKPFNPEDAAITGLDKAGDPIIGGVPNMQTLQTAKIGLDEMIEGSLKDGRPTKYTAALTGFKNRLLDQINSLNPAFKEANKVFAGPMSIRDAVGEGADAAASNRRFADVLDEFRAKDPNIQQGYRIGYADRLNSQLESGQTPSQLLPRSQKGQIELNELSLDQGPLRPNPRGLPEPGGGRPPGEAPWRTFMNREDQMARTTQQALGGSPTAENVADMTATSAAGKAANALLARLNPREAWGHAWEGLKSAGRGETEGQRTAIAKMLLLNSASDPAEYAALLQALRGGQAQHLITEAARGPRASAITSGVIGATAPGLTRVYVRKE
jgi:hypothetical protein